MKFLLLVSASIALSTHGADSLLNVSYDVTREFYADYNTAFAKHRESEKKPPLRIEQSHAGSSKQARAVLDGLAADVVTMNQETDIQLLADAGLVAKDWRSRLPDNAAPYTSTIVFLVRKGNPKAIKDWGDLVKPGVELVIPNPKTSGNGRYSYLAAWASAKTAPEGSDKKAGEFVAALFRNAQILPAGGRDATVSFTERGIGDALLTFESEALQISRKLAPGKFEVVTPGSSIVAEAPVSVVDNVVDKRGTRADADDYLRYLWSPAGQKIAARHYFRPRSQPELAAHASLFPKLTLHTVDDVFGGWPEAQKHFAAGGPFDSIFGQSR